MTAPIRLSSNTPVGGHQGKRGFLLLLCLILLGASAPSNLLAQSVHGTVLVRGDTLGIGGVDLDLIDAADSTVAGVTSDDRGRFRLPAPGGGFFTIKASRLGYAEVHAEVLIREAEALEIELRMAPEAIPIDPIFVVARREVEEGTIEEFYDRMARMRQQGKGRFLTREQIDARSSLPLALLLQTVPGVWVEGPQRSVRMLSRRASGGIFCSPEFFLDGIPMLGGYRDIFTDDLEGVEVYRGYEESVPGVFPNGCGQIFIWMRPGWGHPFTWRRTFVAAGFGALTWFLTTLIGGT